jgi:hypothetical protein
VPLNTFNDEQAMKACQAYCPTCPCLSSNTTCSYLVGKSAGVYRWVAQGTTAGVVVEKVAAEPSGVRCSAKGSWN